MEEKIQQKVISSYCKGEKPISIYTDLNRSKVWFSHGSIVIRAVILRGVKTNPRHPKDGQPRSVKFIHRESSL